MGASSKGLALFNPSLHPAAGAIPAKLSTATGLNVFIIKTHDEDHTLVFNGCLSSGFLKYLGDEKCNQF